MRQTTRTIKAPRVAGPVSVATIRRAALFTSASNPRLSYSSSTPSALSPNGLNQTTSVPLGDITSLVYFFTKSCECRRSNKSGYLIGFHRLHCGKANVCSDYGTISQILAVSVTPLHQLHLLVLMLAHARAYRSSAGLIFPV